MAKKKIIWTHKAIDDKIDILDYWIQRNKSKVFSIKLNLLFNEATHQIAANPETGKPTDYHDIRIKIVRYYLIYYLIIDDKAFIVRIWDSRRDPDSFSLDY